MPIVFEPLVSSPQTFGTGVATLPRITSFGTDVPEYGIARLPRLRTSGVSVYGTQITGTGVARLPLFKTFGLQAAGAWGVATLPRLRSNAVDNGSLVPQGSAGVTRLPAFSTEGVGYRSMTGDAAPVRLRVTAYGQEAAGDYGVARLPKLSARGLQAFPAYTGYATLVTPAPYMNGYAALIADESATDSLGAITEQDAIAATVATDTLYTIEAPKNDIIKCLFERIELTGSAFATSDRKVSATDGIAYSEALRVAWKLTAEEGLDFVGQAQSYASKFAAITDSLHALGVVANRVDALTALATSLAINGMIATGWALTAIDTVEFQDALAGHLVAIGKVVDSAGFADTPSPAMRLSAFASESLSFDEDLTTQLDAYEALQEQVLFYTTLRFGDAEYSGWVMNEGAVSEYRNYPFNSFVKFKNKYYGAADDGLYLLEGSTDNGDPISAHITTALMDFGTGLKKRVPDVYLAFAGGNTVVLKVTTTSAQGSRMTTVYTATVPGGDDLHNGRVKVGQGLTSRYWQFTLANTNGDELRLDELAFRPITLDRRL